MNITPTAAVAKFMTISRAEPWPISDGFITKKYGTYFSKVKMGVLNHQPDKGLPFDIAVGASFSL